MKDILIMMTSEQAKERIKQILKDNRRNHGVCLNGDDGVALNMAMQALEVYEPLKKHKRNDDLIYRRDAVNAVSVGEGCGNICRNAIERIPKAYQARIGRWIRPESGNDAFREYILLCSECGFPVSGFWGKGKFCPACGAKMENPV